jgi:transcriptional regulator
VPKTPIDLLYGTLDVLVLKTLSSRPMHGYAITTSIRAQSEGALEIDDAALYKSLHRLEQRGHLDSEWGLSENNRRAKYYQLTTEGRKALRAESTVWRAYATAVFKVLGTS